MKISTAEDVYRFVGMLKQKAEQTGALHLVLELDAASHLGSSGLEVLGAIRNVLVSNLDVIERLLGIDGKAEAEQMIKFVDGAFGR